MIIVKLKNSKDIDRCLKIFKTKVNKSGLIREIKDRMEFKKPSVKKREIKLKAIYIQKIIDLENK